MGDRDCGYQEFSRDGIKRVLSLESLKLVLVESCLAQNAPKRASGNVTSFGNNGGASSVWCGKNKFDVTSRLTYHRESGP